MNKQITETWIDELNGISHDGIAGDYAYLKHVVPIVRVAIATAVKDALMEKTIIHLQSPFNEEKATVVGSWDIIAKNSTLCWQQKGKRTLEKKLVTCKKCLFQIKKYENYKI